MASAPDLSVKFGELRWRCDPDRLGFETTDEVTCCTDIIGQDRALNAIKTGLEITSRGYNIYVSGLTGTGKSTTIQRLLEGIRRGKKELEDICFVNNFRTPEMPICIALRSGGGIEFKKSMATVLKTLREHLPKAFDSEAFLRRQKGIMSDFKRKRNEIATALEIMIGERGFRLLEVQYGPFTHPVVVPLVGGEPVEMDKLPALLEAGKLTKADYERIKKDSEELTENMEVFLKQSRELDRELAEKISSLEKQVAGPIVDTCIGEVQEKFSNDKVRDYLKELREHTVQNLEKFKEGEEEATERKRPKRTFMEFEVNLLVDNSRTENVPVITETAPNYRNLFGSIERLSDGRGDPRTDFTMIRAGSLLRANGGYLVLSLSDIIEEPAVWPTLKRALKNQQLTIQSFDSLILMPVSALKPEPIDLDVKVVLIGDADSYQILYQYDEDFKKIFKVKADFDSVMPNVEENLRRYSEFVKYIIVEENLLAFHKSAVAAVVEEGVKIAGRQDKLSTRFSDIADVIRESSYWAKKNGDKIVELEHVEKAVEEKIQRVNLIEEKISEMIANGTILLDIDGRKVGQVNGLAVYDLGDYSFGKPTRITVETSMGRGGIINIEREADLSSRTHNKGVLILEGYIRRKYAQDKPLTMSASICFEQSYSGIDGDSASSTEIYGLLSSLADLPIRQDLAATGSVNQKGEIQPIGGVNEKIEGFFDVCRFKGLTGKQGVIIPKLNTKNLMLRKDVVTAISERKFNIYAIETIDEGIELLTGVKMGKQLEDGGYEKDSVNYLVDTKLGRFAEQIREYIDSGDDRE